MLALIDYEWVEQIFKALEEVGIKIDISIRQKAIIILLIVTVAVLYSIIVAIIQTYNWLKKSRNRRKEKLNWLEKQIEELPKFYDRYITLQQRWLFIKTRFQETPPNEQEDPSEKKKKDKQSYSIDYFIRKILIRKNKEQTHFFILGGSGMGKTFFVTQLVRRYIYKYGEKNCPYPIKLLYCRKISKSEKPLLERIGEINRNTILILDALDENNDAIVNYGTFLTDLFELIAEFKIVIITCRTQFFEKQKDELRKLPIGDPGSKGIDTIKRYYVSPFSDKEVKKYLNRKYFLKFSDRKKAQAIADNCKDVMSRPLLLSFMDDLLDAKIPEGKESIVKVYEILIDKWLEREATFAIPDPDMVEERKTYKQNLLDFSNKLALCMVQPYYDQSQINDIINDFKRKITEKEKITEVDKITEKEKITEKNLKIRSLLIRNTDDEYVFAHRSFMEYLVAKQLIDQHKQKGWFSLEKIDCVSNNMIPLFLFYMMSNGKPTTISFRDNRITFSDTSDSPQKYGLSTSEQVLCIESEFSYGLINYDITKYLLAFIKNICNTKNNNLPVNLIIDCNYHYFKLLETVNSLFFNNLIVVESDNSEKNRIAANSNGETFIIPNIIFEHYDFADEQMISIIEILTDIIPCYYICEPDLFIPSSYAYFHHPKYNQLIVSKLVGLEKYERKKLFLFFKKKEKNHQISYYNTHPTFREIFRLYREDLNIMIFQLQDKLKKRERLKGSAYYDAVKLFDDGVCYIPKSDSDSYDYNKAKDIFNIALKTIQDEFGDDYWATKEIQKIVDLMEIKFQI